MFIVPEWYGIRKRHGSDSNVKVTLLLIFANKPL